jgi:DNA-binding LytR/AlgR family response regulator
MKQEIKIGIVEDELLIAEKIKMILTEIGYLVCEPVSTYETALDMIRTEKPDFLLLDVNLRKEKDGIDIAQMVNEQFSLPFIFLTANSDMATIERAKAVKPYAYLVKPFTKEELFASIEIAFTNFNSARPTPYENGSAVSERNYLFVRDNHRFIKVPFNQITYIESRENYVDIHTTEKKTITIRSTFSDFLSKLPAENFFRVHRSYAIRTDLIENVGNTEVTIGGFTIPLSNNYRDDLYNSLGIQQ